ncbi:MAG: hypothetical protein K9K37_06185 [Desulfocapsa sp.]|nr:hypothetical protein [Desulfocapsa sp.]
MSKNGFQLDTYADHCNLGEGGKIYNSGATYSDLGGNISQDPGFVNPDIYDYHLNSSSPCIDMGINSAPQLPATDFEGDNRTIDGDHNGTAIVDIGADEAPYSFPWVIFYPAFIESTDVH